MLRRRISDIPAPSRRRGRPVSVSYTHLACRALFERFLDTLDAKITLKDLGVTEDKLRQMAEDAFFSMKGAMENTPVPITVDDAVELYRKSM